MNLPNGREELTEVQKSDTDLLVELYDKALYVVEADKLHVC